MDSYRRQVKLRMIWWCTWWFLVLMCVLLEIFWTIDAIRLPEYSNEFDTGMHVFWLLAFTFIAYKKFPRFDRLLQKDVIKNPANAYAKAMILERMLAKQRKHKKTQKEKDDLEARIKEMEEEISTGDGL